MKKPIKIICILTAAVLILSMSSCSGTSKKGPINESAVDAEHAGKETDALQNDSLTDTEKTEQGGYDIYGDLKTLASSHDGYNLTPQDSEKLFDVAWDFCFTNIRDFSDGKPPLLSFAFYMATVFDGKYKQYDNEKLITYINADDLDAFAEQYFGFSYDLPKGDRVELTIGALAIPPFLDVIRYETEQTDQGIKVTVIGRDANLWQYDPLSSYREINPADHLNVDGKTKQLISYMYENNLTDIYQTQKDLITSGDGEMLYSNEDIAVRITYLSDDGYTPKKFLSYESYRSGWE